MLDLKDLKQNFIAYGNLNVDVDNNKLSWMKIKAFKFVPNKIYYKNSYLEDYKEVSLAQKETRKMDQIHCNNKVVLKIKFSKPLPIDVKKKKSIFNVISVLFLTCITTSIGICLP